MCCGNKAVSPSNNSVQRNRSSKGKQQISSGPCSYTDEMLENFRDTLVWFKDRALHIKNGIASRDMNKYIGIVLSAINNKNKCTYETQLEQISDVVDLIISIRDDQ